MLVEGAGSAWEEEKKSWEKQKNWLHEWKQVKMRKSWFIIKVIQCTKKSMWFYPIVI